ncbi:MAG: HPF/RaiA family ribosome-associated protein [Patescibacteria group bacterium]
MRTIYKTKNTTLNAAMREYLGSKVVGVVEKLIGDDEAAMLEIEFALVTRHHRKGDVWRAEANLILGKKMIRAEETGDDPHAVIDALGDELSREIKSFKDKSKTKNIRGGRTIKKILKKPL